MKIIYKIAISLLILPFVFWGVLKDNFKKEEDITDYDIYILLRKSMMFLLYTVSFLLLLIIGVQVVLFNGV